MDEVALHREPPSNLPTLVTALGGWIDAGEAATDAMRFLVRQLAAVPLAAIDPDIPPARYNEGGHKALLAGLEDHVQGARLNHTIFAREESQLM